MDNKRFYSSRIIRHLINFPYIWIFILLLLLSAFFACKEAWGVSKIFGYIAIGIFVILFLTKPMNAVYGLMGTSGSIQLFFFNFLFITLLFAIVYHFAFFKDAGISYDINQPHIDYCVFADKHENEIIRVSERKDTILFEHQLDSITFKESIVNTTRDTIHYQIIDFWQVWRSSILTTLTQEPADLFTIAAVHNSAIDSTDAVLDKQKSSFFEWILIFHIIISWIFFGVFISLLYNKFRYES